MQAQHQASGKLLMDQGKSIKNFTSLNYAQFVHVFFFVSVGELRTDLYLTLNRIIFNIIPRSLFATLSVTKDQGD